MALFYVVPSKSTAPAKPNAPDQITTTDNTPARWEYKVVSRDGGAAAFNMLGEEGWELVAVVGENRSDGASGYTPPAFYFKRKK